MSNTLIWKDLVLPHILKLKPYASARDEFSGDAKVFLDANENPFDEVQNGWNRYPDPLQKQIKTKLSQIKGIVKDQIFLGNGSDEAIDLLFRIFCKAGESNVITCPPTYGMYAVSSSIHDVENIEVPLTDEFQLNVQAILDTANEASKLLFICSPNNPTGNSLVTADITTILENFKGIVVIDEAYIDFSSNPSWTKKLDQYPNLVVLQTLSKAWGLASARLGMAFADKDLISVMNKVKPPYNISGPSQKVIIEALEKEKIAIQQVAEIIKERESLKSKLLTVKEIQQIYPSDANFLLVKITDAPHVYQKLINQSVVVRDRSKVKLCQDCLRITVGTKEENDQLLNALTDIT